MALLAERTAPAPRSKSVAYVAARCAPHREQYFLALEAALGAEALGACHGRNASGAEEAAKKTGGRQEADYMDDAVALLEPFRFAMAFENANVSGYVTEKIVNAFLAGAVPIYWGHPDVFKVFNARSFVYAPDFATPEALAAHLTSLTDEDLR